ncbi:MAG: SDR family NAD(P)-dependent oxidoreductase, partial [Bacilli bacterium]
MNKCAIITGGLKGIGQAIALQLAVDGYNIIATYVSNYSESQINEFKKQFPSNIKVECIKANVASFEESQVVFDKAIELYNQVDV